MRSIWELSFKDLVSPGIAKMQASVHKSFGQIAVYESQLQSKINNTTAAVQRQSSAFSGLGSTVLGVLGVGGAIGTITALGYGVLTVGNNMEQTRTAFNVLLGDVTLANTKIKELQEFADVSPFNTQEVFDAGQKLLGFGVANEKLLPIMNQLGDVSQGNAAKFSSMIDNYGKLVSAGRANTMDLNQFAIAGIPIWKELEKLTGKQGQALRKYVEENGVSVQMIDTAIGNLTGKGGQFFGMMDKQSQTTAGRWSTLMSGIEQTGVKIFNALQPYLNSVIGLGMKYLPVLENALRGVWNAGKETVAWMREHQLLVTMVAGAIGGLAVAYATYQGYLIAQRALLAISSFATSAYLVYLEMQAGATFKAALAQLGLNAAFLANPITWVVAGLAALVAGIVYAWNHFEGFRMFLYKLWYTVKEVFSSIGSIIWDALKGSAKLMLGIFTLNIGLIKSGMADLQNSGNTFAAAITTGTQKGYAASKANDADRAAEEKQAATSSPTGNTSPLPFSSAGSAGAGAGSSDASGSLPSASGGGSGNSVVINIQNLVGKIEIVNSADGIGNMQEKVKQALLSVVNDVQIAI